MAASRVWEFWANNPNIPAQQRQQGTFTSTDRTAIVICKYGENTGTTYTIDGREVHPEDYAVVELPVGAIPGVDLFTQTYVVSWGYSELLDIGVNPTGVERNGYRIHDSGSGSTRRGLWSEYDYIFPNRDAMLTAIDNGEITPIKPDVYFDVYIDGSDKPSIFVNWTAGEELPVAGLSPRICYGVDHTTSVVPEYITDQQTGLVDVNVNAWFADIAGSFTYGGSYETTYLSIQQHFEQFLNASNKILWWGPNGEPEFVKLYLRMVNIAPAEGTDGYGDLATVTITKGGGGSYILVEDSAITPGFNTHVRLHYGEPDYVPPQDPDNYPGGTNYDGDGPGQYDPDDKPDPTDFTTPAGFDGNAILTKTYAVSAADLINIGQKLWSQDYFNVLKIQNNPIENIIAVKHFPFAMPSGTTEEIKIGDVSFGVNGEKIASVQSYQTKSTLKIGSYTFAPKYKNYLDLVYTTVKIFLPYIGFIQLDPAEIYGSKITVFYYVDLVTGQCMARLVLDEQTIEGQNYSIPYMTVYGQMGVDIPLTSSDRVQTELRTASAALTAVGGSAGQLVSGNVPGGIISGMSDALSIACADYTTQRTSSQSPSCSSFDCQDVFVMIARPAAEYADENAQTGYGHLHGYPCHKYKRLSDSVFKDGHFVQIERRTDLKIAATSEENRMLEELLTSGVYI